MWQDPTRAHHGRHRTTAERNGRRRGKSCLYRLVVLILIRSLQLTILADTEGTFRPERIAEIAERFGGTVLPLFSLQSRSLPLQLILIKLARTSSMLVHRTARYTFTPPFHYSH
jgi:hypothetical protein